MIPRSEVKTFYSKTELTFFRERFLFNYEELQLLPYTYVIPSYNTIIRMIS